MQNKHYLYHLTAGITTLIWGTTMVSSKVLLLAGLTPAQILIYRFGIGYIFLWILHPHTYRVRSLHDELLFLCIGITGGSLYFLTENTALIYTHATNVSLICALSPFIVAMINRLTLREKLPRRFWAGSVVAFAGVAMVILNGNYILKLNPAGDLLAFAAIFSWAVYCVLTRQLHVPYNPLYITRNLFFYGMVTMIPYFCFVEPFRLPWDIIRQPVVWGNLLFLGLVASSLCYVVWTWVMRELGVVKTNSYLYISPPVTVATAFIVLSEQITTFIVGGTVLILFGLWIAGRKKTTKS
ncbi:MAG: DMT family transporter [Tannerella sp.]|jgi:drug/metabolite transporter (DMT)-like permease|nr:DMT family transporter [Tannerella sp.]